jgi:DNA-binding IclR family transcriptional regulator
MSSLTNGLAILGLLRQDRAVLRVGEVCRDLGIPKASASRLLRTLADAGLLEREPSGPGYAVGPLALLLGGLFLSRHSLIGLLDEALDALVAEFGFTGYISTLSGRDIVLLRVKQGSYPLRHVRAIGSTLPSWRTTMGRALLSRLDNDAIQQRLSSLVATEAFDLDAFLPTLAAMRRRGIATGGSVLTPGITTLATALLEPASSDLMALALAFPDSAADADLRRRMTTALTAWATKIGTAVGDPGWRR